MTGDSSRLRKSVLVVAVVSLLCCAMMALHAPQQAARSYLTAYMFFLGPALGSVALLMVHALTGGDWGTDLRPPLLAATGVLPVLALLLLPVLLSAPRLYPWLSAAAQAPGMTTGPQLAQQHWYLNLPFFLARAVGCFALWLWLARDLRRRLLLPSLAVTLPRFAALGLIVYLLTVTVGAVDWVMSLVPAWHSSVFGLLIGTGQLLAGAALAVASLPGTTGALTAGGTGQSRDPRRLRDLGSLLLALVLGWSYLAFMDYLTAWSADLPGETEWYLPRLHTSWQWLAAALVACQIVIPFAVLLSRRAKQSRAWLRGVAGLLLLGQAAYALWLVLPDFRLDGFSLRWTDALAWVGIGGTCWAMFDLRLARTLRAAEAAAV